MLTTAIGLLAAALFISFFIVIRSVLRHWSVQRSSAGRLSYRREGRLPLRFARWLQQHYESPYRHVDELLEALALPISPSSMFACTAILLTVGMSFGLFFFNSVKGMMFVGGAAAAAPYTLLRMVLIHRQLQMRIDFLPAVELFYQCCLMNGGRQLRVALQRAVEEKCLLGPMQSAFEQLYRNLSVRGDDEASLRIFATTLGHVWADYFVNIVRVGMTEGHPISESLKELITDMRKARRSNQQERNKLLEIRLANFSPVLFLALFIGINFYYNADNAYLYYVLDPGGRDLLLNAFALIFGSFLMGLWLSRKKM
ncbi:type II secretion system F family protein [Paenibacillus sp. GCM10027626]|uniref:type II secretion system F family protein n=1 Tax=Paenibacillus sp. GCM10027626 TaxID=3273411 RepID=UPI003638110B